MARGSLAPEIRQIRVVRHKAALRLSESAELCQNRGVRVPYFQVDAFAKKVFSGNPAGVCPLEE